MGWMDRLLGRDSPSPTVADPSFADHRVPAYDQIVGLDLSDLTVDGCIAKAPCGGETAGRSPVDHGKKGTKRSLLVDGRGIPLGCVIAGAHRHDSPLLRPTLRLVPGSGSPRPPESTRRPKPPPSTL